MGGSESPELWAEKGLADKLKALISTDETVGSMTAANYLQNLVGQGVLTSQQVTAQDANGKYHVWWVFKDKSGREVAIGYADMTKVRLPGPDESSSTESCDTSEDRVEKIRKKIENLKQMVDEKGEYLIRVYPDEIYRPGKTDVTPEMASRDAEIQLYVWLPGLEELFHCYRRLLACTNEDKGKIKDEIKRDFVPRLKVFDDYHKDPNNGIQNRINDLWKELKLLNI